MQFYYSYCFSPTCSHKLIFSLLFHSFLSFYILLFILLAPFTSLVNIYSTLARPFVKCCIFGKNAFGQFCAVGSRIAIGKIKSEKLYTSWHTHTYKSTWQKCSDILSEAMKIEFVRQRCTQWAFAQRAHSDWTLHMYRMKASILKTSTFIKFCSNRF